MFHYPFDPSQFSETARVWWNLFGFYLTVAILLGIAVYAALVLIPFIYSRSRKAVDEIKPGVVPGERGRNAYLAVIVVLILASFLAVFVESYISVNELASLIEEEYGVTIEQLQAGEADGALVVEVRGFQWGWTFKYPNGIESDVLYLPAGRPVIFKVTSDDVFHAFSIPDLRVKVDAIPGQVNMGWTVPQTPGTYRIQCYELCGVGHAEMISKAVVLPPELFDFWYESLGEELVVEEGG
ncbi:MAG: cytochrome c oxidase subunit II [Desulfurococcales archaeon]|nr:cytochrome c oxidase subunit II [Desulfurococcales archaeon]